VLDWAMKLVQMQSEETAVLDEELAAVWERNCELRGLASLGPHPMLVTPPPKVATTPEHP